MRVIATSIKKIWAPKVSSNMSMTPIFTSIPASKSHMISLDVVPPWSRRLFSPQISWILKTTASGRKKLISISTSAWKIWRKQAKIRVRAIMGSRPKHRKRSIKRNMWQRWEMWNSSRKDCRSIIAKRSIGRSWRRCLSKKESTPFWLGKMRLKSTKQSRPAINS